MKMKEVYGGMLDVEYQKKGQIKSIKKTHIKMFLKICCIYFVLTFYSSYTCL